MGGGRGEGARVQKEGRGSVIGASGAEQGLVKAVFPRKQCDLS